MKLDSGARRRAESDAPLYELITRQEPGDIAHEMVNLVSYMLALFFVNQEAHSLFWFFFYLNVHPLITSVLDALSECMPCLWDEFVFKTFLAGLNTVVFCYFASSTIRGDDGELDVPREFGSVPTAPLVVFIVVGVVQVAVAVAFYIRKLRKKAEEDAGQNTDQRMLHLLLHRCADGGGAFVTAGVAVGAGCCACLYCAFTPDHPMRANAWVAYVMVLCIWLVKLYMMELALAEDGPMTALNKLLSLAIGGGCVWLLAVLANGLEYSRSLVYVLPPCRYPADVWASAEFSSGGAYAGVVGAVLDEAPPPASPDNCTMDDGFGWEAYRTPASLLEIAVPGTNGTSGRGAVARVGPFDPLNNGGWALPCFDFVSRARFEAHHDQWTADGYVFVNATDGGTASFDYAWSIIIIVVLAIMIVAGVAVTCAYQVGGCIQGINLSSKKAKQAEIELKRKEEEAKNKGGWWFT